ncbi:MAG: hypothetical protein A2068_13640 [Ignavibacteria bacterium GWB2_35_6b]|nr:MAG: hypothetical protein A2068_13640 [Ignavibacteria bacterium GWB2_35_6b]
MNELKKIISLNLLKDIFKKDKLKYYLHKLVTLNAAPTKIGFSVAIGIFIGLLIPMGLQTIFVIPLAMATGSNVAIAYAATLISNPFTIIPIYYLAIKIGVYFTKINFTWNEFNVVINNPSYANIMKLGTDGLIVFFTGSFLQAIIFSALFYIISVKTIVYLRKRKFNLSKSVSEDVN